MSLTKVSKELAYLSTLQQFEKIKPGLTCMQAIMTALKHPARQFPSVHIAGTNGKGSTAAFLANILQANGLRVALYTSPHLRHFNERIVVNGQPISDQTLARLISTVKTTAQRHGLSPTYFEFTTALAFLYFARQSVDLAVIEVGMGGDLDATNVITPLLSIITNIDLDHTSWLGHTKSDIAAHKAGIIKPSVPVITAERNSKLLAYFQKICQRQNSPFYPLSDYFNTTPINHTLHQQTFALQAKQSIPQSTPMITPHKFTITLLGPHQITNAATALLATQLLQTKYPHLRLPAIRRGLRTTNWPGRFDIISHQPFIIIDGAHNEQGISALVQTLDTYSLPQPDTLIIGIKNDKDPQPFINLLTPRFRRVIVTEAKHNPFPATKLAQLISSKKTTVSIITDLPRAISQAKKDLRPNSMLLITGSLYLVGDALTIIQSTP